MALALVPARKMVLLSTWAVGADSSEIAGPKKPVMRLSAIKLFWIRPPVWDEAMPLPRVMARSQLRKRLSVMRVPLAPP
jgi:hypothetical protein